MQLAGMEIKMVNILKILVSIFTSGVGFYALIKPKAIQSFTGLKSTGPRGITEIRSIFGALFIALGVAAIALGDYLYLGVIYLAIAAVRLVSMVFIEKSTAESSNIISFVSELLFGIILVI
jgi:hypothetical protein